MHTHIHMHNYTHITNLYSSATVLSACICRCIYRVCVSIVSICWEAENHLLFSSSFHLSSLFFAFCGSHACTPTHAHIVFLRSNYFHDNDWTSWLKQGSYGSCFLANDISVLHKGFSQYKTIPYEIHSTHTHINKHAYTNTHLAHP